MALMTMNTVRIQRRKFAPLRMGILLPLHKTSVQNWKMMPITAAAAMNAMG